MIKLENKSNGRYYYLALDRDLLRDISLIVYRGSHVRAHVTRKKFTDPAFALAEINKLVKRRLQRGYVIT